MRNVLQILLCLLFPFLLTGQNQTKIAEIDSINHLPYNLRIDGSPINIHRYQENLKAAQRIGYEIGAAESQSNLSLIYYYKGLYDLSMEYFFEAITIYKEIDEPGRAGELYGLYGYRLRQTDVEKAEEFMLKGLKMSEAAGNEEALRALNDNYGLVKEAKKQYDSAFHYYYKSLQLKEEAADSVGIPYSLNKIAALKATLGEYDEAKVFFDRAYQLREALNDGVGLAENLSFYGTFYESQQDYDKAIHYFEKALLKSKEVGYNWLTFKIYGGLSESAEAKKDYRKAYDYLKQHLAYKDSIYTIETTSNRNALEVQFETKEKEKELLKNRAELAESSLHLERKNKIIIGILALSSVIILIVLQFYRVQRLKNRQLITENALKDSLIKIETKNKIQEERLRISRDLHDNIGSQLTFIIMSLDNLKTRLNTSDPIILDRMKELDGFAKNTIDELRDTIWAMNKDQISIEDLQVRISNFVEKAKRVSDKTIIRPEFSIPEMDHTFTSFEGVNIYRIIQEAIQNAYKYSNATEILFTFEKKNTQFVITIKDNGIGFDVDHAVLGNGILNMKKRAAEIGATLSISSHLGEGSTVELSL